MIQLRATTPTAREAIVEAIETLLGEGKSVTLKSEPMTTDGDEWLCYTAQVYNADGDIIAECSSDNLCDAMGDVYGSTPEISS